MPELFPAAPNEMSGPLHVAGIPLDFPLVLPVMGPVYAAGVRRWPYNLNPHLGLTVNVTVGAGTVKEQCMLLSEKMQDLGFRMLH